MRIKDHLRSCHQCRNRLCNATSFKISRKCITYYDTKVHEALLEKKKLRAQLNKQLHGKKCFIVALPVLNILT